MTAEWRRAVKPYYCHQSVRNNQENIKIYFRWRTVGELLSTKAICSNNYFSIFLFEKTVFSYFSSHKEQRNKHIFYSSVSSVFSSRYHQTLVIIHQ